MQMIPFATPLVMAALVTADGLYVRGYDKLTQVSQDGAVRELHAFEVQGITAYAGLAQLRNSLFTFDQAIGGPAALLEISPAGEVTKRGKVRRPVGLADVAGELLLLDDLVPITQVRAYHTGHTTLVAEARNLTHWLATPDALLWSDDAGLWQYRAGAVTQLLAAPGILRFTPALVHLRQQLEVGWPMLTVRMGLQSAPHPVPKPAEHPVLLHELPAVTLLQTGSRLAAAAAPAANWSLPAGADEATGLIVAGGQLWHLASRTQLRFSPDGQQWTSLDLPLVCSHLCSDAADGVVASGRRGAVWLKP